MGDKSAYDISGYLTQVSYDIRLPMKEIMAGTDLILHENVSKKVRDCVNDIRRASAELMAMNEDIGDLVRLSYGMHEVVCEEYKCEELMLELRRMIDLKGSEEPVTCRFEFDNNMPYRALGDKRRIYQMICKLVLNAFEFTKEGEISCLVQCLPDKKGRFFIKATVSDAGPGVLNDSIVKIMGGRTASEQTEIITNAATTRVFLAKKLSEQMGGRLMVRSVKGQGSTFTMLVAQQAVGDLTMAEHDVEVADEAESSKPFRVNGARALVMGYDKATAHEMRRRLTAYGVDADVVESIPEAGELMSYIDYDMGIIVDTPSNTMADVRLNLRDIAEAQPERAEYYARFKAFEYSLISGDEDGSALEAILRAGIDSSLIVEQQAETSYNGRGLEALEEMGLNTKLALANFNGDEEEYRNVLLTLCRSSDTKGKMLNHYLEQHDYKNYIVAMHGILGVAKVIGAERLMEKTRELEKAAKQGLKDIIEAETPALSEGFEKLLSSIRDAIDSKAATAVKGAIDKEDLISIICELKGYLEEYQIDEIEELFYTLAQFSYPDSRVMELIHQAEEHMLNYDYNEVLKALDAIMDLLK